MITPKAWGYEDEIINADYCGKRMFVKEQHRCSIHKHAKKDEVLMVSDGLLAMEVGEPGGSPNDMIMTWLQDNERVRVRPDTWHRFTALRDTVLMEFSTHHEDADSTRHVASGKADGDEFRALLENFWTSESRGRVMQPGEAKVIADGLRSNGRKIGLCNGCFDLIHMGHVELLSQAKDRCEKLFVAVNTDESVRRLKGDARPFVDQRGRIAMLASIRFVDYVVPCDGSTCMEIVDVVRPHVYVTSSEHGDVCPEARAVVEMGGTVEVIGMLDGYNTTKIALKIARASK